MPHHPIVWISILVAACGGDDGPVSVAPTASAVPAAPTTSAKRVPVDAPAAIDVDAPVDAPVSAPEDVASPKWGEIVLEPPTSVAASRPDPACAAAAASYAKLHLSDARAIGPKPAELARSKLIAPHIEITLTRMCSDDRWERRVVACVAALRHSWDLQSCVQQLPAAQHGRFMSAMFDAAGWDLHVR